MTPPAAPRGEHGDGTPLVSMVLVTFNRVNVLEDTLRSLLAETLDDFELIVCDDASTDGTPVVMAERAARDPRILYVRQPRNLSSDCTSHLADPDLLAVPIPRHSASACRTASFSPRILATDPVQ